MGFSIILLTSCTFTEGYNKPCRCKNTVSHSSKNPVYYKKAAYRFYARRAFEVCSKAYTEEELTKIKIIATENGYAKKFINKVIYEFNNKKLVTKSTHSSNFCCIKYIPQLYERIRYGLKKYGITLIAKPPAKLQNFFHKRIDPVNEHEKAGVYVIPFTYKNKNKTFTYIGMTPRKIQDRLKEDMTGRKREQSTALSRLN